MKPENDTGMSGARETTPPSTAYIDAVLDAWDRDTAHVSSSSAIMAHPAHAHLVSLGKPVLERIMERMHADEDGVHVGWFSLLGEISGHNPVPEHHAGEHFEMIRHWKAWALANPSWAFLPLS